MRLDLQGLGFEGGGGVQGRQRRFGVDFAHFWVIFGKSQREHLDFKDVKGLDFGWILPILGSKSKKLTGGEGGT